MVALSIKDVRSVLCENDVRYSDWLRYNDKRSYGHRIKIALFKDFPSKKVRSKIEENIKSLYPNVKVEFKEFTRKNYFSYGYNYIAVHVYE